MEFLAWLLGLKNVTKIESVEIALSATWAKEGPFWVVLGVACLLAVSLLFYLKFQQRGGTGTRITLALMRGVLLALLFITLAIPVLKTSSTRSQLPYIYLLIDGTESMAIADPMSEDEKEKLAAALDLNKSSGEDLSRMDYVKLFLNKQNDNLLTRLAEEKGLRVEAFIFDGDVTSQVRRLSLNSNGDDETLDPKFLASQLTTKGKVTAIGNVLADINQQFGTGNLAGVVIVSDFASNSGVQPLSSQRVRANSPAKRLGVPIYTVGIGAAEARDLAVDVQTDPKMKKAEKSSVIVKLRQSGLQNEQVEVRVFARQLSGESEDGTGVLIPVGTRKVTLDASFDVLEFSFTPKESGRFEFIAEVDPISGEVDEGNNRARREVNIIDDYLRLMYVASEPTWEWRFVKEVFHRDKLVGMEGFRTFLASSDPRVRETNVLFMPTLTPKRSEFFKNDVIFLGDMPNSALNDRFCEMVKEYVGQFGGGLVVIAGPRFGPGQLYDTPLADMLPVVLDPDAQIRDEAEFPLRLTASASTYSFMNLGANDIENAKAWDNLRRMNWYYPVANKHDLAVVLAEHPTDKCLDGKTPQPLIAIRRYGKGEVVYLAFNEMWRLRRKYGEKYYRDFWSQLIYRLGMSHALGAEKRFLVRADRQVYQVDDKVTLTVEAYNENYEALTDKELTNGALQAELVMVNSDGTVGKTEQIAIPLLRNGVFEVRLPVYTEGEYSLRVKDPVTGSFSETRFDVASTSAERRGGIRNVRLQEDLAAETRGRSYDLTTVSNLVNDLNVKPIEIKFPETHPLWSTPLWFIVLVGLMLSEWFFRKMVNLT